MWAGWTAGGFVWASVRYPVAVEQTPVQQGEMKQKNKKKGLLNQQNEPGEAEEARRGGGGTREWGRLG